MKERISEFLKAENKTSAQFAEEIGVQPSGISHILSGRNKPSLDFVVKMLEKYKSLSTEWLLFGKGSMYKEPVMPTLFDQIPEETETSSKAVADNITFRKDNIKDQKRESELERDQLTVEKIVWFYDNNSFKEYYPEKE